jgi:hypothetical protein
VHRVAKVVAGASTVRNFRVRARLAAGVPPLAAPRRFQRELELLGAAAARHFLNWASL